MNLSEEELKKILPDNGPDINEVSKYIDKYKNEVITIKYGGNVFIDRKIFNNFIKDLSILQKLGLSIVVVHGGGPRIKRELEKSDIKSKFIRGLRVTDEKIINIVENVLIDFNNDIVSSLRAVGSKAISLNTKEENVIEILPESKELGFVGIPNKVNSDIILYKDQGIFYILAGVKKEKCLLAINKIKEVILDLQNNGITEFELNKVKESLINSWIVSSNDSEHIGDYYNSTLILENKQQKYNEYIKEIKKISLKNVNKIAKKLFSNKMWSTIYGIKPTKSNPASDLNILFGNMFDSL